MKRLPRPCLDCGVLTTNASRCDTHQVAAEARSLQRKEANLARRVKKAKLYNTRYQAQAKAIRATATTCYLCGEQATPNDPIEADHLYPSLGEASPLAPAHRSCNIKKSDRDVSDLDASEFPAIVDSRNRPLYPPAGKLRGRSFSD